MKYSFLEFDEQQINDFIETYMDVSGQSPNYDEVASYQHMKDTLIMKQLIEIIEMQQKCMTYYKELAEEKLSGGAYLRQTIAAVENKLKDLK